MATSSPDDVPPPQIKAAKIPFWRDVRLLVDILGQVLFFVFVFLGLDWLIGNFIANSKTQGLQLGFEFLNTPAGFDIKEGIAYKTTDLLGRALWVGLVNTIWVSVIGIMLTTPLGLVMGLARLSDNWLMSKIAAVYVETVRNIPLLVQLFFIYFAVILKLPSVKESIHPLGLPIYLNQRGMNLPGLTVTGSFSVWLIFIAVAIALVMILWFLQSRQTEKNGQSNKKLTGAAILFLLVVGIGWLAAPHLNSNQAIMTAKSRDIASFDDFEQIYLVKINRNALKNLGLNQAVLNGLKSVEDVTAYKARLEDRIEALNKSQVDVTNEITAQIDNLQAQMEVFDQSALTICAVASSVGQINAVGELHRRNIPFKLENKVTIAEIGQRYAAGDCDLLAGASTELSGVQALLKMPEDQAIMPVNVSPLILNEPIPSGFNIQGGVKLSPEFVALLAGLVSYTGAFISESVRAGILAVPKGQSEAARALGLSEWQRLRLIVLPQAARVIIPPMTSQYLNLIKNSSLAVAIGYPDLVAVGNTVLNQSGYAVQVVIIFMISYLGLSLIISALLNWYNKKMALVER